jgi:hypothetical protein
MIFSLLVIGITVSAQSFKTLNFQVHGADDTLWNNMTCRSSSVSSHGLPAEFIDYDSWDHHLPLRH